MLNTIKFHELLRELGAGECRAVIAVFAEEAQETITQLGGAIGTPAAAQLCHGLRGAAEALGFDGLARLCLLHEDGKSTPPPEAAPDALGDCLQDSIRLAEAEIDRRRPA
ncbi:hypothetical protein BV394_09025 [Brevirhabdus pacifica]|uniref:Uncharacterized protein n=1 Tax=Brevirhabdus pacifica TaxID=1267768 RepID=A0A1U7DIP4_9RHOB|nr:Hpt domain-containing protein [Brevirhabdus pacifica]APX89841.1 hypothetical protein BV394_09025 [Brevirhabdus pacifica]OWU74434.1 hypothetical protein ATO5_13485 [Loktanella sp. 22II-4b]PJJ82947.1 Hpt domain-containing protein [Brevirhabdus pacifica]